MKNTRANHFVIDTTPESDPNSLTSRMYKAYCDMGYTPVVVNLANGSVTCMVPETTTAKAVRS